MEDITTALLISTYNYPEALNLVLKSIAALDLLPTEILIADDGSSKDTKVVINNYRSKISAPIKHIWHEDLGFRKAQILNKAIAKISSEYIIQVDGDCFLHPKFIKDHIDHAIKGHYLYGTRVRIKQKWVPTVLKNQEITYNFFSKEIKKRPRSLYLPFLGGKYASENSISPKFRGCNTSFWRGDIIRVNGYNEDFEGWGREDSELMIRLHNSGVKGKRIKFCGIVYHLDHEGKSRHNFNKNDTIQQETILKKTVRCNNGLDKYLESKVK